MDQSPMNRSEVTLYNELHALIAFSFSSEKKERIETLLSTDYTSNTEIEIVKVHLRPPLNPRDNEYHFTLIDQSLEQGTILHQESIAGHC